MLTFLSPAAGEPVGLAEGEATGLGLLTGGVVAGLLSGVHAANVATEMAAMIKSPTSGIPNRLDLLIVLNYLNLQAAFRGSFRQAAAVLGRPPQFFRKQHKKRLFPANNGLHIL
jgi:hypothetical protein